MNRSILKKHATSSSKRPDKERIAVEVLPLNNYVASAEEHQDRLDKHPEDISYCHVTPDMLKKYL